MQAKQNKKDIIGTATIQKFFKLESAGGIILFTVSVFAILLENSLFGPTYDAARDFPIAVSLGSFTIAKPLLLWVNDGLMAIFFLLVGLELKREVLDGQLASRDQIILPLAAAIGGIALPALIYLGLNYSHPNNIQGWAIPAATDIAFALGVLSLFGRRVPVGLKIFLTALAIFDDLAAIIIIALFYTSNLSTLALALSAFLLLALYLLNRLGFKSLIPFVLIGLLLWVSVLKSGVHATLAGVALAIAIPFKADSAENSPLIKLEHALHPWVAFGVLPIFAFLNAGVSLTGVTASTLANPVALGITLGLFLGKQFGAFGAAFLVIKLGLAKLPENASWLSLYAICVLAGIGFTMSLFIGTLAFSTIEELTLVRLGVITGSLASAIIGAIFLQRALKRN